MVLAPVEILRNIMVVMGVVLFFLAPAAGVLAGLILTGQLLLDMAVVVVVVL